MPPQGSGPKLRITLQSIPEERRRFREYLAKQAARQRERAEEVLRTDPAEAAFWQRIAASYEEAAWIIQTGQFPNGRPMLQQFGVELELWALAINAIEEHQARRGRANATIWAAHSQQGGHPPGPADER